jgi:UDP-glucose 4-epimerase
LKILVTGGAGFIGSHVVDRFINEGHTVSIVDDLSTGRESNLNPRAHFYKIDIRDPHLIDVFTAEQPEVVSHHAAQMDVRKSVADPLFDASVNVLGALNVLEAARKSGVRKFIHISSGGTVYGEPRYLPCDEAHPIAPLCPYGITKHTFEHYLYLYQQLYGLDYTVFRYPNVYGSRQDPHGEAGVIAIFCGLMLKRRPVTIFGDGEQLRDYVFVADCARANLLAAAPGSPSGIFNLGSAIGTSVNQLFAALKHITAYPLDAAYAPARPGEIFKIYLDARLAQRELGWTPSLTLTEGLQQTVDYFKANEVH